MQIRSKNLIGVLILGALLCATIYGAVACNYCDAFTGFLASLPVFISAFVAWRVFLFGKSSPIAMTIAIGALSGMFGTLIWPTGYHLWGPGASEVAYLLGPLSKVLLIFASFLGAAIATILNVSFPCKKTE